MKRSFSLWLMVGLSLTTFCPAVHAGEAMVTRTVVVGAPDAEVLDEQSVFLHALSELHRARNYISRQNPHAEEVIALTHIDNAIRSLQIGSVYNCDDYNLHPSTDATLNNYDRYHIGLQILQNVKDYLRARSSDRFSQGYQHRAASEVGAAIDTVEDLIDQET